MTATLAAQTERVAAYAADRLDVETRSPFGFGIALRGLLATELHVDAARRAVDRAIETQTSDGLFMYGWGDYPREWARWVEEDMSSYKPTVNSALIASSVADFYERTGEERYLEALERQYAFYETCDRTTDGGIYRRLDAPEIYGETMYFLCPWFIRYAEFSGRDAPFEDALTQIDVHLKHLQDPHTGLFRHIWCERPNSYPLSPFWSRGNGWGIVGLVATMERLPADHPARREYSDRLRAALETLLDLQDRTGFWHLQLDNPETALESTGTLINAYTMKQALALGVVSDDRYAESARRAMSVCRGVVDDEGAVRRASKPPASANSPMGVTLYGQGWFLKAADCFL